MTEVVTPGDNAAPPVAPAAPAATPADSQGQPSSQPAPTGSEPDNNTGSQSGAMVPSDRLREETEKRRQAEEEAQELRDQLEAAQQSPTPQPGDDDDLDPDTEKLLDNYAKKRGLVSQSELDSRAMQQQVKQDIQNLVANPPVAGIPYDDKAVIAHANANGLPITSKNALVAAYRDLNWDKIVEAERQRAIDGFKTGGGSGAEKPGSSGGTPPAEPEITGRSPRERAKERIRLARQKLST